MHVSIGVHFPATERFNLADEHMAECTILIVEDNPADILLVQEYLNDNRGDTYSFIEAATLQDALNLTSHYDFDAILLDLKLQDSSGMDTVRKIVAGTPETAVVVLTGLQDEDIALQAVRYGAQDFLEKRNLSPETLSKSLHYAIERKRALQEKEDLLQDLQHALERIATLENLLPLCIGCKKILGDNNKWYTPENYFQLSPPVNRDELICPRCQANLEKNS